MAQLILPQSCPLCNRPIEADQPRRIVGVDLSRWPHQPPVNLWGHRSCAAGREELIQIPPIEGTPHVKA